MKKYNIILKITKYCLIFVLLLTSFIIITFILYSRNLDFSLPEKRTIDVYDANGDYFFSISNGNKQSYCTLEEMPSDLINAFISIEDKRFFKHNGIDFIRIGGAIYANIEAQYFKEGASTITQQYVRNLFLTQDKQLKRKLKEAMISINIESKYSKNQILEGYLNTIYFGHGVYGVGDAAMFFFGKRPLELSLAECATLASIPKGPSLYSPIYNFQNNSERKCLVLNEMLKDEVINIDEFKKAINEDIVIIESDDIDDLSQYYQDQIISEIKNIDILKISSSQALKVFTSFDPTLLSIIEKSINKYYPKDETIEIAIFALDTKTKQVLACIGGKSYSASSFNRATKSLRQPASTIKPFLYYSALEHGFTPITTIYSGPTNFNIDGEIYSPSNFGNIYPNQEVTMAYALATSDNIYALKTHLFLGIDALYNTLKKLNFNSQINKTVSLCLGTSEVYLSDLVNAYSTIGSLGLKGENIYITEIRDNDQLIYSNTPNLEQTLNENSCYILSETMTNVFDNNLAININVTGAPVSKMLTHQYAAKSGSTDYDNWMIGYNSVITLGVWCGYDDNQYVNNSKTKFIKYIWADIMESYMQNKGDGWYNTPSNVVAIPVNPTNGKIATNGEYQKTMYFDINNVPWYIF